MSPRGTPGLVLGLISALALSTLAACGSSHSSPTTHAHGSSGATGFQSAGRGGGEATGDAQSQAPGPLATIQRFYRLLNGGDYSRAWAMLPASIQQQEGSYSHWRAGYRATIYSHPKDVRLESRTANAATVSLLLRSADTDACTAKEVKQTFSGTWSLRRLGHSWQAQSIQFTKIAGATPTLSATDCASSSPPAQACTPGYSPCLPPASDYDCAGGGGDGPKYINGPVQVSGSDPYGLDLDGDGIGCD